MTITLREKKTGRVQVAYGVHKSGPRDEQTKFLIHQDGAWRWVWAVHYEPLISQALPFAPLDLLAPPEPTPVQV